MSILCNLLVVNFLIIFYVSIPNRRYYIISLELRDLIEELGQDLDLLISMEGQGGLSIKKLRDIQAFSCNHFAKFPLKVGLSIRPFDSQIDRSISM